MQPLSLAAAQLPLYHAALSTSHTLTVEVRILDLSGNLLTSIRPRVNSGQVNVDADADVTRSATLEFDDPTRSLQFNSDAPTDAALYFDRIVQLRYTIPVPGVGSVTASAFTGPLTKLDRTGDVVSVEAQGKESLAQIGVPTMTLKRGHNAVDAIRSFLRERCGETQFAFPSLSARLPHDTHVSWDDDHQPWVVCKKIATAIGKQLYYDGAGVCRLRDEPGSPVFTFHTGPGSNVTSLVQVSHVKENLVNRVKVVGANKHIHAELSLDTTAPGHALSPSRLARNGVKTYYRRTITDKHIRSNKAARARVVKVLDDAAKLRFTDTFNAVPVGHLDELDLVRIETDEYSGTERIRQWSFPLTGGDMTVGYRDLVSTPSRKNNR